MGARNQTQVVEFVFMGFSGIPNSHIYLFLPFLAIYLVTILGNLMIFTMIQLDSSLHTPMYYFLSHLSCLDICISSVTVPKILVNFLYQQQTIPYNQCMAQMFFFLSFTGTEALLLAVMAYDRYTAICKPLHYSRLMSTKLCILLSSAAWFWGFLDSALHTALSSKLYFCGVNQIHHIFCDLPPLIKITCSDTRINEMVIHITSLFVGVGPFLFFLISFTGTEALLLAIMAYDRYAAICKPLHYSLLMNTKVCTLLAFATWICGFLDSALHTALGSNLYFCETNQIRTIFCNLPPLMKISCSDTQAIEMALGMASLFVGVAPFLFTILSYIFILSSILKIHSTTGKRKAFSTCASHLIVVIIYYGNALLNYDRPSSGYSLEIDTLVSTMFCIIPPMLNPLIYSLRNKEVKGALKKVLESQSKSTCLHTIK